MQLFATNRATTAQFSAAAASTPKREVYDAGHAMSPNQMGTIARKEGQAPVADPAVNQAYDNAGLVYDFYRDVLGRDSLDGRGMTIKSVVHFRTNFANAFWNGRAMYYGDGDGKIFSPLTNSLDVVGHEMTHAVTQATAGLEYEYQSGALNESWSDVFGELIEQWHENPQDFSSPAGAKKADWMIGEDIFTPGTAGDALRSMKQPGTANKQDPQPGHMRDYQEMDFADDKGGVHVNSGIPNRAAYEAAVKLGGEKVAKIWYHALTEYLRSTSQFSDAAKATIRAAQDLYGGDKTVSQAVADAWEAVGVSPNAPTPAPLKHAKPHRPGWPAIAANQAVDGVIPPWLFNYRA